MGNLSTLWEQDETPVVKKQQSNTSKESSVKTYGKFKPEEVTHLAIHHTGGTSSQSALNWWKNPASGGVGAHYVIDRDGSIIESAPMTDITGHIMPSLSNKKINNKSSLGIEIVAPNDKDVTPEQKEAVRKLYEERILPTYPNIKLENIVGHGELAKGYTGSHARHPDEGMSVVNYLKENLGKKTNNISAKSPSSMSKLWEEDVAESPKNKPIVTIEPYKPEEYTSPEGNNLITSQTAYDARGIPKLIQQGLTGLVSAPVSAILGAGEPIAGVAQLAGRLVGNKTTEDMINAFQGMRGGLKEASGPLSYATNRPAELAGELGPITTNMANYVYKGLPLASDLGKATIAGLTTGSLQGVMSPTEANLNKEEFLKQKASDVMTSAAIGSAFPVAIKSAQFLNKTTGLNLGAKVANAPTQQQLVEEASNLFKKAEESGIQFNPTEFSNNMGAIAKNLRSEGYAQGINAPLDNVFKHLQDTTHPKDFTELQALRKMIQGQQKSADPETRRLASILKDNFDDYVLNAPNEHITTGGKNGARVWKEARNSYNKLKKAEIFDDMLDQAQIEGKTLFTQSGSENSLAKQLRQLVKNDKKMRTFTPEEQKAIKDAAKGGTVQNLLRFYGKFAPTGPVSLIPSLGGVALNPVVGVPLSLGAAGSRVAATKLRERDVSNLADLMRVGKEGQITPEQTRLGDLLKMYELEK
jgi:hypothetical protein